MAHPGRYMNDDEDDPQPIFPQRFILADFVALLLGVLRGLFGTVSNGFDAATTLAQAHSNAVADERDFVTGARSDITQILHHKGH